MGKLTHDIKFIFRFKATKLEVARKLNHAILDNLDVQKLGN
jgi:hypothetical protein